MEYSLARVYSTNKIVGSMLELILRFENSIIHFSWKSIWFHFKWLEWLAWITLPFNFHLYCVMKWMYRVKLAVLSNQIFCQNISKRSKMFECQFHFIVQLSNQIASSTTLALLHTKIFELINVPKVLLLLLC